MRIKVLQLAAVFLCGCSVPPPTPNLSPGGDRTVVRFVRPDGIVVLCSAPRPDLIQTARTDRVRTEVDILHRIASVERSDSVGVLQIIRPPDTDAFEVQNFALCEAYGNGAFTPPEYGRALEALTRMRPSTAPAESPPFPGAILSFASVRADGDTEMADAHAFLHQHGIAVTRVVPNGSRVVITTDRGLYKDADLVRDDDQAFLTQTDTHNGQASFTLTFSQPLDSLRFTRPAMYALTASGITHPAWSAHAFDSMGREVSAQSENLTRSFHHVPQVSYMLKAPGLEGIAAVRFDSDPRLNGHPFAAVSAILIEELRLYRRIE